MVISDYGVNDCPSDHVVALTFPHLNNTIAGFKATERLGRVSELAHCIRK